MHASDDRPGLTEQQCNRAKAALFAAVIVFIAVVLTFGGSTTTAPEEQMSISRKAHGAAQYDDDDLYDGEDDGYTPQQTDEYYDETAENDNTTTAPTAAAVVTVTFVADEERKRKEAAELRKQQAAAEAKHKADAAALVVEARERLEHFELLPSGLDDAALVVLYTSMRERRQRVEDESAAWADQLLKKHDLVGIVCVELVASAPIPLITARVNGSRHYYQVSVSWQAYPSAASVVVETTDAGARDVTQYASRHSEHCGKPGFATMMMDFCVAMAAEEEEGSAAVDVRAAWAASAGGESLDAEAKKRGVMFVESAPPCPKPTVAAPVMKPAPHLNRFQRAKLHREAWKVYAEEQRQAAVWAKAAARETYERKKREAEQRRRAATEFYSSSQHTVDYSYNVAQHENSQALQKINASIARLKKDDDDGYVADMLTYVRDPSLIQLPTTISQLASLTHLDLTNCALSNLPSLGSMRLRKLFLSGNAFETIPWSVMTSTMADLRVLDMSHNRITEIPAAFNQLTSLEILQMEYNEIASIKCDFALMPRLEVIELTDNNLRQLPPSIGGLERLWRLKIAANPLTQIPPEVYHKGAAAVKTFFCEMTPQNLAVPPSALRAELLAATAREDGCDAEIHFRSCDVRLPMLAALVQARLPALDKRATLTDNGIFEYIVVDQVSAATVPLINQLVLGELQHHVWASLSTALQIELSAFVNRVGSVTLQRQFKSIERGAYYDPCAVLAEDLESWWGAGEDRPVRGRVARFLVGAAPGVEIAVHRELLCARSEYFSRMLRGGLAESAMAVVPLEGVEADVFRAFVAYVYGDNTSKMTPENVVSLLFLAVEYDCARLKAMAECVVGLNVDVTNCAQVLQIAHYLDATRLRKACICFASMHFKAVRRAREWAEVADELKLEIESRSRGDLLA